MKIKEPTWNIVLSYFALKEMCNTNKCKISIKNIAHINILNQYRRNLATQANLNRTLGQYFKPPFLYEKGYVIYIGN